MSELAQDNVASVPTAEQTEQQLLQTQQPKKDPMQGLSDMFTLYKVPFTNLVTKMSNNSLRRLIRALVFMPLDDMKLNLKNKEERMAWQIGEELLKAKLTMIHYTLIEQQMKQEQERQATLKENTVQTEEKVVESTEVKV
jgi:hypothetical protein